MKLSNLFSMLVVLLIVFVVAGFDFPGGTMLWNEIQNAAHAPAFGVIAIAILFLLRNTFPRLAQAGLWCFVTALGIAIGLGAFVEIIQYFIGRDAEFVDVMRDALGAGSFLAMYFTIDPRYAAGGWSSRSKAVVRLISILVFLAAFATLGICAKSYAWRNHEFPLVCDFGSRWSAQFIKLEDAAPTRVTAPPGWSDRTGLQIVRLQLGQSEYPGITVEEPYPD
ncbi:MAG: VanZ family protein, partial [candidate division Zixibacteria bacterium]|nr:VanZ family protein [candidate division Zixibacteria bacterium]